jgi:hypothetical protein
MKTKDGYEYKDGMTLYGECLGQVTVHPTKRLDPHSDCGEYADGDPKYSVHIPGFYAKKDAAYQDAINYWLMVMNQAREKLAALNKEHFEWLTSTGPAATASASNAVSATTTIPSTPNS